MQNSNNYFWDFGDGTPTSSVPNPVHTYISNGNYTVCLTTGDSCISNTFCDTISLSVGISEFSSDRLKFTVYPNPINNENAVIEFLVVEPESVKIVIFNSIGQEIIRLFNDKAEANHTYILKLNTTDFHDGVYLAKFLSDNENKLLKFVISR